MNELIFQANIYEPVANSQQLIGDDFFLQLAIRNLHLPIWRYKGERSLSFLWEFTLFVIVISILFEKIYVYRSFLQVTFTFTKYNIINTD